jgi:hypothetical protein
MTVYQGFSGALLQRIPDSFSIGLYPVMDKALLKNDED